MAGYVKVFSSITSSSLWGMDHRVLRVFVYMLANCDVEGVIEGAAPELAHRCHLSLEEWDWVLGLLMSPDPHSRTPDNDGRRIATVPGGWKVLNYHLYRDRGQGKEGSRAPYMRTYREQRKNPPKGTAAAEVDPSLAALEDDHALQPPVTRDTNANANANAGTAPSGQQAAAPPPAPCCDRLQEGREQVLKLWAKVAVPAGLPEVLKLQGKLLASLNARLGDPAWLPLFREAVPYVATHREAAWMRGQGERHWRCSLAHLVAPGNAERHAAEARAARMASRLSRGSPPPGPAPARASPGALMPQFTTWAQQEAELRSTGQRLQMAAEDLESWVLEKKAEWDEFSPAAEHHEESMC